MTEVIIENNQQKVEIDDEILTAITAACNEVLKLEGFDTDAEVSVTIVDNEAIKALNKEFRDKDMPTDVLSFPILDYDEDGNPVDFEFDFDDENVLLGDIVISAERAMEQAESFGHSFLREMAFLTVHSMLHLLGYDHVDDAEGEKIMIKKQEEVLNGMNIKREGN